MNDFTDSLSPLRRPEGHPRVATIGTFDGVHRGHQRLIAHAGEHARSANRPLTVITFDQPPAAVLRPDRFGGAIVSLSRKIELLRACGADELIVLPFTRELSRITAEQFMDVLAVDTGVKELFTGEGFALGHNRQGTVDVLTRLAGERQMQFEAIQRDRDGDRVVSSSEIRRAIAKGDVADAASLLGRWYRVVGEVIRGTQVGRTIGYPTANMLPPEGLVQLADGIYASLTHLPDRSGDLPSMTYVGTRPAINTGRRMVETHLLDFDGDLYGQILSVDIVEHIRPDADFESVDAFIAQLGRDEKKIRAMLSATRSSV